MTVRISHLAMAFLAALSLAACESPPAAQKLSDIGFADKRPIQLNVASLEIVPEYQPPGRKPNVEHLMPVSPEGATVRWVKDRLKPMGGAGSGSARVVIRDARVVEVPLKTDTGFAGLFKQEQAERYDGALDVAIEIKDQRGFTIADVVARATRTRTIPEGASLNERDRAMHEISEALIRDVDGQMDGLIRTYLAKWVM
ncbi:hypothetical protein [Magnetospirillum sp. UT-4]|uniref:hypothetical protein n=1 Tax=Magnetospirillum sp. UT-4 TaxID=2681467 RepID=UPI00138086FD|nr:hypothetical protein [Magnetospirillum sp. UT-4]CAA7618821.1 conserved exported hypothetical protein [Magnetospirillum sp. UT-4]